MQATASQRIVVRGRVLMPDGRSAAGTELYWSTFDTPEPCAVADDDGQFRVSVAAGELSAASMPLYLLAHKAGFGIDWFSPERGENLSDITLRLVEDRTIRGRVIDTEGRPVAGARIAVHGVLASNGGGLDAFLTAWKHDWRDAFVKLDHALYAPLGSLLGGVTDADGHVELRGVGAERVAEVDVEAAGRVVVQLLVATRDGFDPTPYNTQAVNSYPLPFRRASLIPQLAGPRFEHVAETEWVIRGTVFTAPDRHPVVGARVEAGGGSWGANASTVTDDTGRYELHGLPRNEPTLLCVRPSATTGLLSRSMEVSAAPGQLAVDLDVELKPGIVVEGRVYDRVSGQGVRGAVAFVPLPGNRYAGQPGYDGFQYSRLRQQAGTEGEFRLLVIPGPGVLTAQVYGGGPRIGGSVVTTYRLAKLSEEDRQRICPTFDGGLQLFAAVDGSLENLENAAKVIDLPIGSGPVRCDLTVDPGKAVRLSLEDDAGRPLNDALVAGVSESCPTYRVIESSLAVCGLGTDRPRRVCVLHPERHLAASLTLTGEEQGPVKVRLGAAASVTGRALDASGEPLAGAKVLINYSRPNANEIDRCLSLECPRLKTDDQGRFEAADIVPGERFSLDFRQGPAYFRVGLEDEYQLEPGQKLELGDRTVKQLR